MKRIILASTSPRRRALLKKLEINFEVVSPDYDENILNKAFSYDLIENIALNKAKSVYDKMPDNTLIISADTVVVFDNLVLGKPKNFDDAYRMLSLLNGNIHKVVTSVCLIDTDVQKTLVKSATSYVKFNLLSEEDLKNYINDFKPYDKAGSYGIQELPTNFVDSIDGDFDNIVGLPTQLVIEMLEEIAKK